MIPGWGLLLLSLAYVATLFGVAWMGDRLRIYPTNVALRPVVYSLALAVYCSSWTFYGAVGSAVRDGPSYLPIYLGPALLFLFALPFFSRLVRIAKRHNVTSIADLVASRFGKSNRLAIVITLIALVASVPYIALQLKAVAMSIDVLTIGEAGPRPPWFADTALYTAALLAAFAILYGTRSVDAAEHHPGLMLAIAAESLVKLLAFVMVGVFALFALADGPGIGAATAQLSPADFNLTGLMTQTLLALTAIFCLPRQFQVGVVECTEPLDLPRARWLFPAYLLIITLMVVPIAALGISSGAQAPGGPDSLVLWLPLSAGHEWLALVAYIGGFSAATGMVIVAAVALATMLSNDLLLPLWWRLTGHAGAGRHTTRTVLQIRRAVIVGVLLLAFAYYRMIPSAPSLASIGLVSFAAVAQFAPAVFASLYWPRASRAGVLAGLLTGFALWCYTLLLPGLLAIDGAEPSWVQSGPWGVGFLAPQALFGFTAPDTLTHGVFWSLLGNVLALVGFSLRFRPTLVARLQAGAFMDLDAGREREVDDTPVPGTATVGDLVTLAQHVLGPPAAASLLAQYAREQDRELQMEDRADRGLMQLLEHELAGAIGAASARMMLTSALRGAGLKLDQVVSLLDETTQRLRLNRGLLEAMMDNMAQAVSVIDRDFRLVAWNRRYESMFGYPSGFLYAGLPVAEAIRYNAARGWCGPGDIDSLVARRLAHLRSGAPHAYERRRPDGRVIENRCQPLADGGLVTTFADVTAYKRVEEELREINETLEQRVEERTEELRQAKLDAEQANLSKTRFVAAASHDLLQPMNAARLFTSALRSRDLSDPAVAGLAERVDTSLRAAEELLDALLDITKLDSGTIEPEIRDIRAQQLLESVRDQFEHLAAHRGLRLRVARTSLAVRTDPRMLRRVLQNFVANALRYTRSGGLLVGCRRRGREVEFQVWDTGPGVAEGALTVIFEEFRRLDEPSPWGEQGLGLGLSICDRIARILDHRLVVRSVRGAGSLFAIRVPRAAAAAHDVTAGSGRRRLVALKGLVVLCLDDDPDILDGMAALLARWEVEVIAARSIAEAEQAVARRRVDVILADFHLRESESGLDALRRLSAEAGGCPGALLTANASEGLLQQARASLFEVMRKPVKPAALRALLAAYARRRGAAGAASRVAAQAAGKDSS